MTDAHDDTPAGSPQVPEPAARAPDPAEETGFRSARSRRRMTRLAWLLGVVAFVLQICLPVVLLIVAIVVMIGEALAMPSGYVPGATLHDGEIWFALPKPRGESSAAETGESSEDGEATPQSSPTRWQLMSVDVGRDDALRSGRPRLRAEFDGGTTVFDRPRLLSAGGELFVLGRHTGGRLRDGKVELHPAQAPGWSVARPLAYQGRPALVTHESRGADGGAARLVIHVWTAGRWAESAGFDLAPPDGSDIHEVQVIPDGERLHVFARTTDDSVLHRTVGSGAGSRWSAPLAGAHDWSAALVEGSPAVFRLVEREDHLDAPDEDRVVVSVVGAARDGQDWRPFVDREVSRSGALTALAEQGGGVLLVTNGQFSGLGVLRVRDGRVVGEAEFDGAFPFWRSVSLFGLSQLFPLFLSALLALVLTNAMRRHRVTEYRYGSESLPYASLLRRGLAEAVDTVVYVVAPVAILGNQIATDPSSISNGFVVFVCLLWGIPVMLLMAYLEGRSGRTPGKWLLGIRVLGLDLQPCGFNRALVRNLLLIIDGVFHYLVGILVIALSLHWQRLGDRSARTIVVRVPRR